METLNLSQVGQRAGAGRAAVVTWRRGHPDFPRPADGGNAEGPRFLAGSPMPGCAPTANSRGRKGKSSIKEDTCVIHRRRVYQKPLTPNGA
ncbi:hypothetical protein, partial [Streptomyces sp. NPDC001948]